jgi:2-oxoglutarate ferredoxin oxidoreductase subunit alpha
MGTDSAVDKARGTNIERVQTATIRFAGDSGDGMQLAGTQFTNASAILGNDIATLPDYPAEIRAPAGTLAGVSGFQITISHEDIYTPGDKVDALIAMNPAALKANLSDLVEGGRLIVNVDDFAPTNLAKARYATNPLEDGSLDRYQVYKVPITSHTVAAVEHLGLGKKEATRCKNFYALGLVCWLYDRSLEPTLKWIENRFASRPQIAKANAAALKAGYNFGETAEMFAVRFRVEPATWAPGTYRNLTGNQATALGLVTAAVQARKTLFYASYPITPASDILHELSMLKHFGVKTFQAEDEIAAMSSILGAAFTGALAATASSGPGIALKQEAIGLGVMTELPCLIIDVQRGGPSTGLPTKTEQGDLWQTIMGRNSECPVPVLAAGSPSDCFYVVVEAFRIATKYMTPVILLADGYIANSAEPWRIPAVTDLPDLKVTHWTDPHGFKPYRRNEVGSRPWVIPGTPGLQHHIGGLEKDEDGNVSYDPENHQKMVNERQAKVDGIVRDIPDQMINGDPSGDLLVVGWGGTYGAITAAVNKVRAEGRKVSSAHLRYLRPFPRNLGDILKSFKKVLVPELNMGQLQLLLRGTYLVDAEGLHKVQGKPFLVSEIEAAIRERLR